MTINAKIFHEIALTVRLFVYSLWVITHRIIVTLFYHLLCALGYYAYIVVIYDSIKLKYSIFKIFFKIIFCTYYALWVITLIRVEFFSGVVVRLSNNTY